jgi:hypothetical protein
MDFAVPKVKVQGLKLQYIQGLVQNKIATTEETNTPKLKLSLGELDLSKNRYNQG